MGGEEGFPGAKGTAEIINGRFIMARPFPGAIHPKWVKCSMNDKTSVWTLSSSFWERAL